jgi:Uma2 family endonuclease
MYDLPSEDPEEPGLPDEFHDLQPQLLSQTLCLQGHSKDEIFTGTDLNLYYDVRHQRWHKRPDWFLVLGVPRLYDGIDLRASYVVWQEGISPFVVVELLSPGTAKEDLGNYAEPEPEADPSGESPNSQSTKETPPGKWQVYEQILRVPYYVVFSRYTNQVRFFWLNGSRYAEQSLDPSNPRLWIPELSLGLGLWQGDYDGITRCWLRWYDAEDRWIPTPAERAAAATERATHAESQLQQVVRNLLQQNMSIEQVAQLMGLSEAEVSRWATD